MENGKEWEFHGSPPLRPRLEGGRGRRRTGGLDLDGAPTDHAAGQGPRGSRVRVVCFVLCRFLSHAWATMTAIRVAHSDSSNWGS